MSLGKNIKILVVLGYLTMAIIAICGIRWIYLEWIKYSEFIEPYEMRTELVNISNTFAGMYQAESVGGLAAIVMDRQLKTEYDSLMNDVFIQIESLKEWAKDQEVLIYLDSLSHLITIKKNNTQDLAQMIMSYDRDNIYTLTKRTLFSPKQMEQLDNIIENSIIDNKDTTAIIREKKGLFRRVGEAIRNDKPDTLLQINTHTTSSVREIITPQLRDTLVHFIHEINKVTQTRNAEITVQLLKKQNELYALNEQTTAQINNILKTLSEKEELIGNKLFNERNNAIKKSTEIVYIIAVVAILICMLFMILILYSISVGQRLHREIRESKNDVDKLLIAREQLMLTISHDIKAPINSIMGYLELIKNKTAPIAIGYIENMKLSSRHILDLIQKLLEYHALDAGEQKKDMVPFSPYLLLFDIHESFVPLAHEKSIKLDLNVDLDIELQFISDPFRIRQIIDNLLSNALKFTPENGQVKLSASLCEQNKQNLLYISIKDNGVGIKDEDKERIFEGFSRLDYSGDNIEGSGLGLSITQKLARLLDGKVFVDSQLGKGSTFTVVLPMGRIQENSVCSFEKQQALLENIKVLFIDDDPIQLNLFSEFLKRKGMNPYTCAGGSKALGLIKKEHFDIVFCDIQMADMDGFALVDSIRKSTLFNAKTIPVIALTGKIEISMSGYFQAGFSDYLSKPFTSHQLFKIISKFIVKEKIQMESSSSREKKGFYALTEFAGEDVEAAKAIMESFIDETSKNYMSLENALSNEEWDLVSKIAHKMIPIMRMISGDAIVTIMQNCENGFCKNEDSSLLLKLIQEKILEAKLFLETNY